MKQTRPILFLCSVILVVCWADARTVLAQGSTFTYQGRLTESNSAANGRYDLKFSLFSAASNGSQIGTAVLPPAVPVSNGLFAVTLDFGGSAFDGSARWLEVEVRTNGSLSAYTTLTPRQRVWPTPYAMHAASAAGLAGNPTLTGTVTFSPASGPPFAVGSSTKVDNLNADWLDGLDSSAFAPVAHDHDRTYWRLLGNNGTSAGVNFLGTTDNQPLELKANGQRALRLEPNTNGAPNLIGGASVNFVAAGTVGAVVVGGGATNYRGFSYTNSVLTSFGTVGGGQGNTAGAYLATIGGGRWNSIGRGEDIFPMGSTIGGGSGNLILPGNGLDGFSSFSTISGGESNTVSHETDHAAIGGGGGNSVGQYASYCSIGGGSRNGIAGSMMANPSYGTISGGYSNSIRGGYPDQSRYGSIPGGYLNSVAGSYSLAAGCRAKANHSGSFVWADNSSYDFVSTNSNSFSARCTGGARFVTSLDGSGNPLTGVVLPSNGGSWSSLSDRNAKERVAPVRGREILQALAGVPMSTWNYKGQEQAIRHIGPMAQDFAAAFKVGEDDRTISTVDADGVALAAIQGLNEIVTEQQNALAAKDARIEALERSVAELRELMTNWVQKANGGTQ